METERVENSLDVGTVVGKDSIDKLWKRARRNRKRDEQLLAEYRGIVCFWKGMILVCMSLKQKTLPAAVMSLYEEVKAIESPVDRMIQAKALFFASLNLEDTGESAA